MLQKAYQVLILRPYFSIRTWWPFWYYIANGKPRARFNNARPYLSPAGKRIVSELRTQGIAISSLEELFPGEPVLDSLLRWEREHTPVQDTAGKKKFLREYWDLVPVLDIENPFVSLSLRDTVIDIVETYMGMWVRLKQYHMGRTIPDFERPLAASQRWHRDPEEKRMCKMFIYLSDVGENAGPFTYVLGSTYGNRYGHLFPQQSPQGSYPREDEVRRIASDSIRTITGKSGTVIFCDTSGLHFGGRATESERVMFTAAYASPLYSEGARYSLPKTNIFANLSEKQRYLIAGRTIAPRNEVRS